MARSRRYGIYDAVESLRPGSEDTYCYAYDQDPQFTEWDKAKFGEPPTKEEIEAEIIRLNEEKYPMEYLRYIRNCLLQETDWMANSDVTMSDDWKAYRQALRDLPANTSDPKNPVWPTKPS